MKSLADFIFKFRGIDLVRKEPSTIYMWITVLNKSLINPLNYFALIYNNMLYIQISLDFFQMYHISVVHIYLIKGCTENIVLYIQLHCLFNSIVNCPQEADISRFLTSPMMVL